MGYGLYVHVPFCVRKCIYCDFYSLELDRSAPASRLKTPGHDNRLFLDALECELRRLPDGFRPATVFIGGGTPTELSDRDFERLLELIARYADLSDCIEYTCESNPGTLTEAKAHALRQSRVNRVSLGVQSFQPHLLEFLGRIHSAEEAMEGFALLREEGFGNINLDLMYGLPGGTLQDHLDDARILLELAPEHLSAYCLMYEKGTPLDQLRRKGHVKPLGDEKVRDQQDALRAGFTEAGYEQYELSNYALPGRSCLHNKLYWSGGEYIGCGPSAHSHWAGERYASPADLKAYIENQVNGTPVTAFREKLEPEAKARETLIMWLRQTEGVPVEAFTRRTGFDPRTLCKGRIDPWIEAGTVEVSSRRIRLSEEGLFISDAIFADLV